MERTLRSYFWPAVGYFLVLEGMLLAAILFWPTFEDSVATLRSLVPIAMVTEMFDMVEQQGVSAYVNGQHFFKGCNTLGTAAAVLFAMGAVAGEAHRGTLELWLSQPFSRKRLLLERYGAGALALGIPIFLSSATVPYLLSLVEESMSMQGLMLSSLHQWAFLLIIYSVTFLCSCFASRPILIALVLLFITALEFALYMVPFVTDFSIFRLVDIEKYQRIMNTGGLDWTIFLPLVAGSGALLAASLRVFEKRTP